MKLTRIPSMALLCAMAGCASSGTATPSSRPETVYAGGATLKINPDNGGAVKVIDLPMEKLWRVLPSVYDSVGVPLSIVDPRKHLIGNEGYKIRATLNKKRLSNYFECGSTQGGANADSYEIHLTVLTNLESEGPTRTKMTTTVTALAKPMQFAQDYSRCSSKAALETAIFDIATAAASR
jgi:hypothetical protein